MNGRTIAASSLVAALAATSGVAVALHAHAGSSRVAAAATSAPPTPVHATVGEFHYSSDDFKINSEESSEVVMPKISILAGASSGWHTHPGPGFILVTAGRVTLYQVLDGDCVKATYGPGQGWVEMPGVVHIARNEGTTDVTAMATFLDIAPGTTTYRSVVPAPEACPGIK